MHGGDATGCLDQQVGAQREPEPTAGTKTLPHLHLATAPPAAAPSHLLRAQPLRRQLVTLQSVKRVVAGDGDCGVGG